MLEAQGLRGTLSAEAFGDDCTKANVHFANIG